MATTPVETTNTTSTAATTTEGEHATAVTGPADATDERVPAKLARLDVGESFYRGLLDELGDGIYFVDPHRRITLWNKGAERITGFRSEEVVGRACADKILVHVDAEGKCLCTTTCPLSATMQDGKRRSVDVFLHHKDGHRVPVHVNASPLFDRYGKLVGGIESFRDSSERQADLDRMRQLAKLAFLDELTGISNRRYLDSILKTRFAELERNDWHFGVIMIDIDDFKKFNDNHGHETGDRALQVVTKTISTNCRSFDSVGRWGGEEFLVLAGNASPEDVGKLADQLCSLVAASHVAVGDKRLSVTISLGATFVRKNDTPQTLVKRADELLYRSKQSGRNRATFG